jgi:hypothetical protein
MHTTVRHTALALLSALLLMASLAVTATPAHAAIDSGAEAEFVKLVNGERAKKGLGQLRVASDLVKVARRHSQDMAAQEPAAPQPGSRRRRRTTGSVWRRTSGEGLRYRRLHKAFMDSPGTPCEHPRWQGHRDRGRCRRAQRHHLGHRGLPSAHLLHCPRAGFPPPAERLGRPTARRGLGRQRDGDARLVHRRHRSTCRTDTTGAGRSSPSGTGSLVTSHSSATGTATAWTRSASSATASGTSSTTTRGAEPRSASSTGASSTATSRSPETGTATARTRPRSSATASGTSSTTSGVDARSSASCTGGSPAETSRSSAIGTATASTRPGSSATASGTWSTPSGRPSGCVVRLRPGLEGRPPRRGRLGRRWGPNIAIVRDDTWHFRMLSNAGGTADLSHIWAP